MYGLVNDKIIIVFAFTNLQSLASVVLYFCFQLIVSMVVEEAIVEMLVQQDQGRLVKIGICRFHIGLYYHPVSILSLETITIVVILDQEVLMVHGVLLLILTLDGSIVMSPSVVSTH